MLRTPSTHERGVRLLIEEFRDDFIHDCILVGDDEVCAVFAPPDRSRDIRRRSDVFDFSDRHNLFSPFTACMVSQGCPSGSRIA